MSDLGILLTGLVIGVLLGWCGKSARDQDADKRRINRAIKQSLRRAKRGRKNWQSRPGRDLLG